MTFVQAAAPAPRDDPRPGMRAGLLGLILLVGVLGLWAATAQIQGAVILRGEAVVAGLPKKVQSLEGGVVETIAVRNGDRVAEGDLLIAFDATMAQARLDATWSRLADAQALRARLDAESRDLPAPDFDAYPLPFALPFPEPEIALRRDRQQRLFEIRAQSRRDRQAQLKETLAQLEAEIAGAEGQISALEAQRASYDREIENLGGLRDQGLLRGSDLAALERQRAEVVGRIATLSAERDALAIRMQQSTIETRQADHAFREKVDTDLRDVTAQIGELVLQIATLTDSLRRIELRAPADGTVHEMQVSTLGGVVAPGETVMQIVPQNRGVEFELRLDPASVDNVYPGQSARVAVPALGPGPAQRIPAEVISVSPDTVTEERTGTRYYRVGLDVTPEALDGLGGKVLVPGMSVEAYLETEARSVLTYLVEPLFNHLRHALRES
ncbi:MAG: HlyD family type I secretion periplasmic adaptor subunit [Pseudooceanicola nanhaiensis]